MATANRPELSVIADEKLRPVGLRVLVNSATLNKDDNTVITEYQVTVGDDGSGSQNVFFYDGTNGKESELNLQAGETVRFIVEDSSIASHPFKLSTTKDGTHNSGSEYTTGKTAVGTQGQSGAYVQLVVDAGTADTLYPYCSSHSGMGGSSVFVSGGYINKDSTSTLTNKTLGATTLSGTLTGGDQEVNAVVFKDYSETDVAISYATDLAINLANGNTGSVTLTGNVSGGIDFTNVPTNGTSTFTLKITQDGTGSRTLDIDEITVNSGSHVVGLTPGNAGITLTTAANSVDLVTFLFFDAGTPLINALLDFKNS